MKINEAVSNPQTTPVEPSLLNYAETFHVSVHTSGQFRRVLDFFDSFVRRDTTPTWNIKSERRIKYKDARVHKGLRHSA
jgi:hypothetical protein